MSGTLRPVRTAAARATLGAIAGLVLGCSGPAPEDESPDATAAERAREGLGDAYDRLAELLDEGSDQAVGRVQEDFENLGDWEYRVVVLDDDSPEAVEAELNALGDARWEAYWIAETDGRLVVYLKRPAVSVAGRIPLATLLRLLVGLGQ